MYVVTGPILSDGPCETIGENGVAVPKRYYKVVLDYREPELKTIGFILPHERSSLLLSAFVVSVDVVEQEAGLYFFHLLPDQIVNELESMHNLALW